MENMTPAIIWTTILAAASAVVLLSNAAEKIIKAVKAAKAPSNQQNERLDALEEWRAEVDRERITDRKHLKVIDDGNRMTQRALLALLDHGIDGNNTKQMQTAREDLQDYLINR